MAYNTVSSLGIESIPNYLSAKSPKRLRALMRKNNLRYRGFVRYSTPHFVEADSRWYVWYYPDPNKLTEKESLDQLNQDAQETVNE